MSRMKKSSIVDRNTRLAIWYLISTLMCVVSFSYLVVMNGTPVVIAKAVILISIIQFIGLVWTLQSNSEKDGRLTVWIKRAFLASTVLSIACLAFTIVMIQAEYHMSVEPDAKGEFEDLDMEAVNAAKNCYVYETEEMYFIFPQYTQIKHVTKIRPSKDDDNITFSATAAFQHHFEWGFRHDNIDGAHAEIGEYHEGHPLDDMGAFTFYDGEASFAASDSDGAIQYAADRGGSGFQQVPVIIRGEIYHHRITDNLKDIRCFRLLAEVNGRICIIDSKYPVNIKDFASEIQELGVQNALYMDMGAGSNCSWFRGEDGRVKNLFNIPNPFTHNWIIFCKS